MEPPPDHLGTPLSEFVIRSNSAAAIAYEEHTGENGISLPDPVAMAVLLDPRLKLEVSRHYVAIERDSELTRGMTVVDRLGVSTDARNSDTWKRVIQTSQKIEILLEVGHTGVEGSTRRCIETP